MELNKDEYVMLQGKRHPLYRGVLRLAGESGLTELSVSLIQAPSAENGGCAISQATAVFTGPDGKVRRFVEIGDADGNNCGKMIAPHRIRMSATRAKGRALRDALGIGEALIEELGGNGASVEPDPPVHDLPCSVCGADVDIDLARKCQRTYGGRVFCVKHKAELDEGVKAQGAFCDTCGDAVPDNVARISMQKFNRVLCVPDGKALLQTEGARIPTGQIAG